jgi:hypothetical protein
MVSACEHNTLVYCICDAMYEVLLTVTQGAQSCWYSRRCWRKMREYVVCDEDNEASYRSLKRAFVYLLSHAITQEKQLCHALERNITVVELFTESSSIPGRTCDSRSDFECIRLCLSSRVFVQLVRWSSHECTPIVLQTLFHTVQVEDSWVI